jgi:hypothetical protein
MILRFGKVNIPWREAALKTGVSGAKQGEVPGNLPAPIGAAAHDQKHHRSETFSAARALMALTWIKVGGIAFRNSNLSWGCWHIGTARRSPCFDRAELAGADLS